MMKKAALSSVCYFFEQVRRNGPPDMTRNLLMERRYADGTRWPKDCSQC